MTNRNLLTAAITAFCLVLPGAMVAQETSSDAPSGEAEPVAPAAELQLGEELVDGIVVGSTYIRDQFGDWEMRCVKTTDQTDPCQLYQLMKDANGNTVAEISLFQLPAGQQAVAGATIVAPLGTLLTEQVTVSVDGGSSKRYPFSYCASLGCYARIGFTADDIAGFERGASATVIIVPVAAPDQRLGLDLSLAGFTNGYAAIKASNAAIAAQ